MRLYLDLQIASDDQEIPSKPSFVKWVKTALSLAKVENNTELTIRLVDTDEIRSLNNEYRHHDYATNVLSFPAEEVEGLIGLMPDINHTHFIGDVVICLAIVAKEAAEQKKSYRDHLAHMVIHGVLHLLNYDHIDENDAQIMENLEIKILAALHIANPYEYSENI